jgi:hypothetical protein
MYKSTEQMKCQEISDGIILPRIMREDGPLWGIGGVCDKENEFVPLSEYHGGWAEHGGFYPWKQEERVEEEVVYFGLFLRHWGHFLVDLIGRLWFFTRENSQTKEYKLAYIGEEEISGNYLEFLELLGISKKSLINVKKPTRFKKVIVPQFASRPCIWYTDEFQSIFHAIAKQVEKEGHQYDKCSLDKVYFSRLNLPKAQGTEAGEKYIANWLKKNDYSLISPEKLSVRDQVYIWNHAKEIVCMDGSIPINVGFCRNKDLQLVVMHKTKLIHKNLDLYLLMCGCKITFLDVYKEPFKRYPKSIGEGPFLFTINEDVEKFSKENHLKIPYTSRERKRIELENFIIYLGLILNIKGRIRLTLSKIYHKGRSLVSNRKRGGSL